MRYFYTDNASYPIAIGSEKFRWEIVGRVAGTVKGVMKLDMDRADRFAKVAMPNHAQEIDQGEWMDALKKKNETVPWCPSITLPAKPPAESSPVPFPSAADVGSPVTPAAVSAHLDEKTAVVAKERGVVRESAAVPAKEKVAPVADEALDLGVIHPDDGKITAKRTGSRRKSVVRKTVRKTVRKDK